MIRFATATNGRYLERMRPYLESIQQHSRLPAHLVCVGFLPPPGHWARGLSKVAPVTLTHPQNAGAPSETESPQHGAWLQAVPGEPDDVCLFTDGDIVLQRDFSGAELEWLQTFPPDTVAAGYNSRPDETLAVEAARLFPRTSPAELAAAWPLVDRPCFNIGVLVGRRRTLRRIYDWYMGEWDRLRPFFAHPARQQWLVCYAAQALGLTVEVPGYGWHANGHYGTPPGVLYENGHVSYQGAPVLFRHRL